MSKLDDAFANIQGYFKWITGSHKWNEVDRDEQAKWMFALDKVKDDMQYFLENAPLGDSRRAMVLQLKKITDKTLGR